MFHVAYATSSFSSSLTIFAKLDDTVVGITFFFFLIMRGLVACCATHPVRLLLLLVKLAIMQTQKSEKSGKTA
jgi:hypothetical protein